ncbi:MAG TPA: efflux RND transporter periplasmic adaptor subunit [Rubricoccaceae bacterium]|nr:efflux RND transporter periplasmic adaptor subunit [Rubricoccaceae bacterium]
MTKTQKKTMIWSGVALGVLALLFVPRLLGGDEAGPGGPGGGPGGRPGGARGGDTLVVTAVPVRQELLEDVVATTGQLMAEEEVELRAEVAGRITALRFQEGSVVRRGQLLAVLDTDVLEAQLAAVRTRRDLAVTQAERQRALFEIGGLSRQALDQAEAEARVLEAEMAQLAAEIARRRIYAPFSGQIGLRSVSPGAYVSPGDPIATLRVTGTLKLEFAVPEAYLGRVGPGDAVVFTVPGQEGTFRAEVYAVEGAVDPSTRAFTVRARTANPGGLTPGAFARVELALDRVEDALVVPASAIVPGVDSAAVFVVEDGKAARRAVSTGIRTADRVQVMGEVAAGEVVLTSGLEQVRPGQPVRVLAQ